MFEEGVIEKGGLRNEYQGQTLCHVKELSIQKNHGDLELQGPLRTKYVFQEKKRKQNKTRIMTGDVHLPAKFSCKYPGTWPIPHQLAIIPPSHPLKKQFECMNPL